MSFENSSFLYLFSLNDNSVITLTPISLQIDIQFQFETLILLIVVSLSMIAVLPSSATIFHSLGLDICSFYSCVDKPSSSSTLTPLR